MGDKDMMKSDSGGLLNTQWIPKKVRERGGTCVSLQASCLIWDWFESLLDCTAIALGVKAELTFVWGFMGNVGEKPANMSFCKNFLYLGIFYMYMFMCTHNVILEIELQNDAGTVHL